MNSRPLKLNGGKRFRVVDERVPVAGDWFKSRVFPRRAYLRADDRWPQPSTPRKILMPLDG